MTQTEWLEARKVLLAKEKAMLRAQDALAAELRDLPMVKVTKAYTFHAADGRDVSLADLFAGKRQLIVYHFMLAPGEAEGCRGCSFMAEHFADTRLLAAQDTAFAAVSRGPAPAIEAYRARTGWAFPWVSSFGSDFNYDFHVTADAARDEAAGVETQYNFRTRSEAEALGKRPPTDGEMPGLSVFYRDGDEVYHSYSTYERGLDRFINTFQFLDVTPLGRQLGPMGPGEFKRKLVSPEIRRFLAGRYERATKHGR